MDLPLLEHDLDASVELHHQLDLDGTIVIVAILKQLYRLGVRGECDLDDGAVIRPVDEPFEGDGMVSIRYPGDVCARKPGTDVVVVGSACGRDGEEHTRLDVLLRVGPIEKALAVFGPRVWFKSVGHYELTPPQPFVAQELRWEGAYGGMDLEDPEKTADDPRNPLGRGVVADPARLQHAIAPWIEDPRDPIQSDASRPAPVGVTAIPPFFASRLRWAGTMDQAWQDERFPLRPTDFDERFHQVAPEDQVVPGHLAGGERVQMLNLSPEGALDFRLPRRELVATARTEVGDERASMTLDTVLLEPTDMRLEMVWRAAFRAPPRYKDLRAIEVVGGRA